MKPRTIILADGPATRWESPVPKHLTVVDGEPLLCRTVRQLLARGVADVWVTSHDPRYELPGTLRYEPTDNQYQVDQFYACRELWQCEVGKDVVFLYGDVYFTDSAMDTIFEHLPTDYAYYQRTKGSAVTGKPWKEGFAMRVRDKGLFLRACRIIRDGIEAGRLKSEHHQLQGYLEGYGCGAYFEWRVGPHGVEIDDETDDFDVVEDVQKWEDNVRLHRQTMQRAGGDKP